MSSNTNFNQTHNNSKMTNASNTISPIKFNFKPPTLPPSTIHDAPKQKLEINTQIKHKTQKSIEDEKQPKVFRQRSRSRQKKHHPRELMLQERQLQLKKHLQTQKLKQAENKAKAETNNQQIVVSVSQQVNKGENKVEQSNEKKEVEQQQPQNQLDIPDNDELSRIMGFSTFKSTKNQNHTKSACEEVRKNTQVRRQYRQYMNRRGGFNRNLDKM